MSPEFLRFVGQWVTFTPDELAQIGPHLRAVRLRKGEALLRPGQVCRHVWFIQQGVLRISFRQGSGDVTRYLGTDGSFITSLASFVNQHPTYEHIEALENSDLLAIEHSAMLFLCERLHRWETLYRKVVEFMFTCSEERIRAFITQTAEERYLTLVRTRPHLLQRVPQKYIASYIGIAPTSLSRLQRMAYERQKQTVAGPPTT